MDTNTQTVPKMGLVNNLEGLLVKYPIVLQLLRFIAIGVINTALDFIVLNVVSKTFNISSGLQLGQINVIGFSLAVVQSYFWNRYWAFSSQQTVALWKNFVRLVLVGALGALAVLFVLFGSSFSAPAIYYLIIFGLFAVLELILWNTFELQKNPPTAQAKQEFIAFLVVSLIGLAINSLMIGIVSSSMHLTANPDLNKNLAKILATFVSLFFNFVGYKIFVFKK